MAVIYESADSITEKRCKGGYEETINGRIIVVYISQNGVLNPFVQNNEFIGRASDGGMLPYLEPELEIKEGKLLLSYQFTRNSAAYTFEWLDGDLVLTYAENGGVSSPGEGTTEWATYDFRSKTLTLEFGHIDKTEVETEKQAIQIEKLKSLGEFGCMFDWEVAKYRYL